MNAIALNHLWTYLKGLGLTASNRKWLADHLNESLKEESGTDEEDSAFLQSPNKAYIENGEVKVDVVTETMSIEEARDLTLKAIELEYSLP